MASREETPPSKGWSVLLKSAASARAAPTSKLFWIPFTTCATYTSSTMPLHLTTAIVDAHLFAVVDHHGLYEIWKRAGVGRLLEPQAFDQEVLQQFAQQVTFLAW